MLRRRQLRRRSAAFTLVEMLIVASCLAIIAGLVVPQVEYAIDDANHSAMLADLHELTTAVERYRLEHGGQSPELVNNSLPQLSQPTNSDGDIGQGAQFAFGPYLTRGVPTNPINGSAGVYYSAVSPPANLESRIGWVYHTETGQIWGGLSKQRGGN